jgi:hypothetical protein
MAGHQRKEYTDLIAAIAEFNLGTFNLIHVKDDYLITCYGKIKNKKS